MAVAEEPQPVEEEFVMDDVADTLNPASLLLEISQHIEDFREELQPMRERDRELLNSAH